MAFCKVGHIYVVNTSLTTPPKAKFALCVCIQDGYFLWINSAARLHGHDQMKLPAGCHQLIKHDSYLDLSRIVVHRPIELESAQEFPIISHDLCQKIIDYVESGLKTLPTRQARRILENLCTLIG